MAQWSHFSAIVNQSYAFLSAKLVLKRTIERGIVFKSHHIDDPLALGFSLNFTVRVGLSVGLAVDH
jgi:hypothetical protein